MSGGGARVSIPASDRRGIDEIKRVSVGKFSDEFINSLVKECGKDTKEVVLRLKLIQDIKDIAKKHNDEDVYVMLKECNMDPNEAAQRLLYIDTFHEVKKKRDKRTVNVNSGTYEDYRRAPNKQWQGARGGQWSRDASNDGGVRRNNNSVKENGVGGRNRSEKVSKSTIPVQRNKENNVVPHVSSSSSAQVKNQSGIAEVVATPAIQNNGNVVQDASNTSGASTGLPAAVNTSIDNKSSLNGTLKEPEPVSTVAVSGSSIGKESIPDESNNVEGKLEKLTLSANLPVTFPDHLQVPETFKKRLTFGSLDAALGDENSSSLVESVQGNVVMDASDENSSSLVESVQGNVVMDASVMSSQDVMPSVREDELPNNSLRPQDVSDSALPSGDTVISVSSPVPEQSKQETVPPQVASQIPFAHSTSNYGFSLAPQYLGILPPEVSERQSGNPLVSSTSSAATQSSGVSQNSLSPPPFPLFRQPFAHGYYPYGPIYPPHYYWPPNAPHHLMGHGGFPPQPYVATPGMKFPVPPPYVQGTNAGNLGHFGVPSAYGAYGSSPVSHTTADATTDSTGNDDSEASQTKEKSVNPAKFVVQQGEDSQAWATAPSREMPPSMPNYFYSLPSQGHHMTYSPAIYHHHLSQTLAASQSNGQASMHQSDEPMAEAAPVEPHPSKSYEQHSPQVSWNVLNGRETI